MNRSPQLDGCATELDEAVHVADALEDVLLSIAEPAFARIVHLADAGCRRVALRHLVGLVSQLHRHRRLDAIGADVIRVGEELVAYQRDLDVLVAGDLDDVRELAGRWSR